MSIADTIIRQLNAPQDLKLVSWPPRPPGIQLRDLKSFAYDDEGGDDTYIYLIENGIEPKNKASGPAVEDVLKLH